MLACIIQMVEILGYLANIINFPKLHVSLRHPNFTQTTDIMFGTCQVKQIKILIIVKSRPSSDSSGIACTSD
jgi:hypothetical protein